MGLNVIIYWKKKILEEECNNIIKVQLVLQNLGENVGLNPVCAEQRMVG